MYFNTKTRLSLRWWRHLCTHPPGGKRALMDETSAGANPELEMESNCGSHPPTHPPTPLDHFCRCCFRGRSCTFRSLSYLFRCEWHILRGGDCPSVGSSVHQSSRAMFVGIAEIRGFNLSDPIWRATPASRIFLMVVYPALFSFFPIATVLSAHVPLHDIELLEFHFRFLSDSKPTQQICTLFPSLDLLLYSSLNEVVSVCPLFCIALSLYP